MGWGEGTKRVVSMIERLLKSLKRILQTSLSCGTLPKTLSFSNGINPFYLCLPTRSGHTNELIKCAPALAALE